MNASWDRIVGVIDTDRVIVRWAVANRAQFPNIAAVANELVVVLAFAKNVTDDSRSENKPEDGDDSRERVADNIQYQTRL